MNYKFSPSLMCMSLIDLKKQIEILNQRADFLHIDIMDGHYVKNFALSPYFIEQIREFVNIPIDAHLMVANPSDFIKMTAKAGANYISIHAEEINKEAFRVIEHIKECGCNVGIVLNPATLLEVTKHYVHLIDKITIMTVDAGFAGQKFIPEILEKIKQAKQWKDKHGYKYLIEVDGSCNEKTFKVLATAGAEVFVLGSSGLFNLDSELQIAWEKMMDIFNKKVIKAGKRYHER